LIAIAMAIHGQTAIPDDGTLKADAMSFPDVIDIDVFRGHAELQFWPEVTHGTASHTAARMNRVVAPEITRSRPIVIHFNDRFAERDPYVRESLRLRQVLRYGWPLVFATIYATIVGTVPERVLSRVKGALRPVYRRVFGYRRVRESAREA
jgi:hypothetical protein